MKVQLLQGLRFVLPYEVQNGLCFINTVTWIVGEDKKAISFIDVSWAIYELNNLPASLFKSFAANRSWICHSYLWECCGRRFNLPAQLIFPFCFYWCYKTSMFGMVTRAGKLAWGSMLAVIEASLPCLLCLLINREDKCFFKILSRDFSKLFLVGILTK